MKIEEYEKIRIDEKFGMNVFANKAQIEIFYKHQDNWIPVLKIEQASFSPKGFIIEFCQSAEDQPIYPFLNKKLLQQVINEYLKRLFNIDWRLPPIVTDILDSWILIRSIS